MKKLRRGISCNFFLGKIMVTIKRVYAAPSEADGFRVLVDRLWPRGISKERAKLDLWMKEIAPTTELRKWFAHDLKRWPAFVEKYLQELKTKTEMLAFLAEKEQQGKLTLIFAGRDEEHNEAVVLQQLLAKKDRK
jgi:uncharacterized protein YeaO (DUF488 family)